MLRYPAYTLQYEQTLDHLSTNPQPTPQIFSFFSIFSFLNDESSTTLCSKEELAMSFRLMANGNPYVSIDDLSSSLRDEERVKHLCQSLPQWVDPTTGQPIKGCFDYIQWISNIDLEE
jgi:hypothetical protein